MGLGVASGYPRSQGGGCPQNPQFLFLIFIFYKNKKIKFEVFKLIKQCYFTLCVNAYVDEQ
jgi:hypothetical protein